MIANVTLETYRILRLISKEALKHIPEHGKKVFQICCQCLHEHVS